MEIGAEGYGRGIGGGVGVGAKVTDKGLLPEGPHWSGGWALTRPVVKGNGSFGR